MFSPDPKIIPSTWARAAAGGTAIARISYSPAATDLDRGILFGLRLMLLELLRRGK